MNDGPPPELPESTPPRDPGPPRRRRGFEAGGPQVLSVTVRMGDRPLETRVSATGDDVLPDVPLRVGARKEGARWVVDGPEGPVPVVPGAPVAVRRGGVEAIFALVRRRRLPRFSWGQGDIVLPVLALASTLLALQIALIYAIFAGGNQGGGGADPSPEYLARLLEEQFQGKDQGVIAQQTDRPRAGDPIESFYLQPGQDGPKKHIGGGKHVGKRVQDGDTEEKKDKGEEKQKDKQDEEAPVPVAETTDPVPPATAAPAAADGEDEEVHPMATEKEEGWGLSDWYDTQDARAENEEIRQQLRLAHELLRLDPNDPYGLSLRAYYEYLATDYAAAERTYNKFTTLYPEETAGWNNLALVYKRKGEYQKEEGLYRVALGLSPDDDHALNNLAVCLAHQGRYDEALAIMKKLETLTPDDPYADLHRAKIYAAMGKEDRAYFYLHKSLAGMRKLDTLHNIEFRQDIRVDPAFKEMRMQKRFHDLLVRFYGDKPGGWWQKLGGGK